MSTWEMIGLSVFLATLIYCIGWGIVLTCFRFKVYKLVCHLLWVLIHKHVAYFTLTEKGETCIISSYSANDTALTFDYPLKHLVGIVVHHGMLFNWTQKSDTVRVAIPSEHFVEAVNNIKADMIKRSSKLHERFDNYPEVIKPLLKGAYEALVLVDKELAT